MKFYSEGFIGKMYFLSRNPQLPAEEMITNKTCMYVKKNA